MLHIAIINNSKICVALGSLDRDSEGRTP